MMIKEKTMKAHVWDQDGKWGWSIFDNYGDEVCASTNMFESRELARQELYAALSDFDDEE